MQGIPINLILNKKQIFLVNSLAIALKILKNAGHLVLQFVFFRIFHLYFSKNVQKLFLSIKVNTLELIWILVMFMHISCSWYTCINGTLQKDKMMNQNVMLHDTHTHISKAIVKKLMEKKPLNSYT